HAAGELTPLLERAHRDGSPGDGMAGELQAEGVALIVRRYELPHGRRYALLARRCASSKIAPGDFVEPPTTWFEARYSIQLSYGRALPAFYCIRFARRDSSAHPGPRPFAPDAARRPKSLPAILSNPRPPGSKPGTLSN